MTDQNQVCDTVLQQDLFARIDGIADILRADVVAAEEIGKLPATSVDALRSSRLYALKSAREAGGFEASLGVQFAVFEKLAYISPSACWNLFISCAGAGLASAFLEDDALKEILATDVWPAFTSGGGYVPGKLTPVEGGFRLTGKWVYGSGIHHAEWSVVPSRVEGSTDLISCVVPTKALTIHHVWDVVGLKGSGSEDYSVKDLFVPARFTYNRKNGQKRGGSLYRLGVFGYVTVELIGFMMGIAQRALDELIVVTRNKSRGYDQKTAMAGQPSVLREIALGDLKLKAARSLNLETYARAMASVADGASLAPELEAEIRAAGLYAVEATIDVVNTAFRFAGGTAIRMESPLQRCLRDIHAAGTHFVASPSSYEAYGAQILSHRT